MRALITGITGFVGSHLAEYLVSQGIYVFGTVRWRSRRENIAAFESQLDLVDCDLTDSHSVLRMMDKVRPDLIFHLAAQSYVPTSWHAPAETISTNVLGQLNLFEAARKLGIAPRIQIACSSEEYGMVLPDEVPIKETNPLRPLSPYGVSKVSQDFLGYQYFRSYGLHIVRTRAFNHTGPRRGDVFVESNFARQIALIEAGKQKPVLFVGNLEARRDYTDVRDVVRAYALALDRGTPGEVYNICSGSHVSIWEVLQMLMDHTQHKIAVRVDEKRLRPSDVELLWGDCSKFKAATGWQPSILLDRTLRELLEYWRARV